MNEWIYENSYDGQTISNLMYVCLTVNRLGWLDASGRDVGQWFFRGAPQNQAALRVPKVVMFEDK